MKNIELTEDHKSKLLEMCNKLFWNGCINKNDFRENDILLIAIDKNYKYNHKILKIHWFEFCLTHLCTKLYNISHLKDESSIKQLIGHICQDVKHPIDYLYEEFKKLK